MLTSIRCHELVYAGDFDAVREAARQRFRSGDGRRAVVPLVDFWVGLSYLLDGRIALAIDQLRTVVEVGQQFAGTDSGTSGLASGSQPGRASRRDSCGPIAWISGGPA